MAVWKETRRDTINGYTVVSECKVGVITKIGIYRVQAWNTKTLELIHDSNRNNPAKNDDTFLAVCDMIREEAGFGLPKLGRLRADPSDDDLLQALMGEDPVKSDEPAITDHDRAHKHFGMFN